MRKISNKMIKYAIGTSFLVLMALISGCKSTGYLGNSDKSTYSPTAVVKDTGISAAPTAQSNDPKGSLAVPVEDTTGITLPKFDHIIMIVLENRDFSEVNQTGSMPMLNALTKKGVLLTNFFAVTHPSLPNYLAMISGDTQGITSDCKDCFVTAPNLGDVLNKAGKTWKTYQEDMPSPCFLGNAKPYYQKHNPFIYFTTINQDSQRCIASIVPITHLDSDLASNKLPDFAFIVPNICNSGHDCSAGTADDWIGQIVAKLQGSSALTKNSLIVITFDEGKDDNTASCCGMPAKAGGQIYTILLSETVKPGTRDNTAYSHYSLLKTILKAWNLPDLGHTADQQTQPILLPWK